MIWNYQKRIILLWIMVFAGLPESLSLAQITPPDSSEITFSVRWLDQLSSTQKSKKSPGLVDRLLKIFFSDTDYSLIRPVNVLTAMPESVWILDQGSQKLILFERDTGHIKPFGPREDEMFPSLVGLASMGIDTLLFTDSKLNNIFVQYGYSESPVILNDQLNLNQPTGIAYSQVSGHIWVAETAAHRLLILNKEGEIEKIIGKRGTEPGEFNFPTSLWIDRAGLIYVVDSMNFRIQILSRSGEIVSVFGEAGDATGYFARPKGIAVDSYGHVYVVDALFHTVQIFDNTGRYLSNFGYQGQEAGEFWLPNGIFIDMEDRIYVADSYNNRVQIFELIRGDRQ